LFSQIKVKNSIVNLLKNNLGLQSREKVLILTDIPTHKIWNDKSFIELNNFVERSIFTKFFFEFTLKNFPNNNFEFYAFPSIGRHGANPGKSIEEKMINSDVVIAMTSYSLTHTDSCENAIKSGARIASMPSFLPSMFYPDGSLSVDYIKMNKVTMKLTRLLSNSEEARIYSEKGTNLEFNLRNRKAKADTGVLRERGSLGNLPAGETFIAPLEGTAAGKAIIPKELFPGHKRDLEIIVKEGKVVDLKGNSETRNQLNEILCFNESDNFLESRRVIAELGIGTNPKAKLFNNILEAEKIKGTVHFAIGDNSHFGGKNKSDFHQDFIIPNVTLILDNKKIIHNGKILIK
jgi:leucyl aminopeptidase (aminopeptidase T)